MNLETEYLGMALPHPFIVGASPLADRLDMARRVEDAGAAALVLRSLFEEQITQEAMATHLSIESHAHSSGEAHSYFPENEQFVIGPDQYLEHLRKTKEALAIPVIASLNGTTEGGWLRYAQAIEQAGADALELNLFYVALDPSESAQDIEERDIRIVQSVARSLRIPLAVKLSPFFTSLAHFAQGLSLAGAAGAVLFNRYYETDIDIDELEPRQRLQLSSSDELFLRLRWLSILSARTPLSLAVTGGVHSWPDAAKAIMAGASAVQMVSALLRHGPGHLSVVKDGLAEWMTDRGYTSLQQMRGSMDQRHTPNPGAAARLNYMRSIQTWEGD